MLMPLEIILNCFYYNTKTFIYIWHSRFFSLDMLMFIWYPPAEDFLGGSDGKESACNVGDLSLIPGSGRFPEEGKGSPLQYSCLKNSMDRRAWQATVHGAAVSDMTEWLILSFSPFFHAPVGPYWLLKLKSSLKLVKYPLAWSFIISLCCFRLFTEYPDTRGLPWRSRGQDSTPNAMGFGLIPDQISHDLTCHN